MRPYWYAISDYGPGTKEHDKVTIIKRGEGWTEVFLLGVMLKDARLIVECLNYCRSQKAFLNGIIKD